MIESHTMVRNGMPYIGPTLRSVLAFVNRGIVLLDDTSNDGTREVLTELQQDFGNLTVEEFHHPDNIHDLTDVRNRLLGMSKSKWIMIVDDDEVYSSEVMEDILRYINSETTKRVLAYGSWFLTDKEHYHSRKSSRWAMRVIRNENLAWGKRFSKETLLCDGVKLWDEQDTKLIEFWRGPKYLHFSYLKPDSWREDMGIPYPKYELSHHQIRKLPNEIKSLVKKTYESISNGL